METQAKSAIESKISGVVEYQSQTRRMSAEQERVSTLIRHPAPIINSARWAVIH